MTSRHSKIGNGGHKGGECRKYREQSGDSNERPRDRDRAPHEDSIGWEKERNRQSVRLQRNMPVAIMPWPIRSSRAKCISHTKFHSLQPRSHNSHFQLCLRRRVMPRSHSSGTTNYPLRDLLANQSIFLHPFSPLSWPPATPISWDPPPSILSLLSLSSFILLLSLSLLSLFTCDLQRSYSYSFFFYSSQFPVHIYSFFFSLFFFFERDFIYLVFLFNLAFAFRRLSTILSSLSFSFPAI